MHLIAHHDIFLHLPTWEKLLKVISDVGGGSQDLFEVKPVEIGYPEEEPLELYPIFVPCCSSLFRRIQRIATGNIKALVFLVRPSGLPCSAAVTNRDNCDAFRRLLRRRLSLHLSISILGKRAQEQEEKRKAGKILNEERRFSSRSLVGCALLYDFPPVACYLVS